MSAAKKIYYGVDGGVLVDWYVYIFISVMVGN